MAFNPDLYLARKKGVGFKDPNVEREYTSLDDDTKRLALNSPAPVTITSGRRSLEENNLVGGVPNSKHLSGEAFDVRKTVAPEALNYFKDNGYQVLNEGDHYHVEKNKVVDKPKEPVKMAFDPDKYLSKKRALIQGQTISSKPPIEQEKDSLAPIKTGFRDFTKAATLGLSEPIQAGLSTAAIESIKGEKGIAQSLGDAALGAINPALPFVRAVQRNPNLYKSIRDKNAASLQQLEEENPKAALIGELAGYVAPATATSKVYGATGKLAEKVVPNIGSSLLRRAGTGIGKAVVRGGGAGAIGGAIDPEQDVLSGAAGGAIGDVIGSGVGKAIGKTAESLKKQIDTGVFPKKVQGAVESIPGLGGWIKGGREAEEKIAQEGFEKNLQDFSEQELRRKDAYELAKEAADRGFNQDLTEFAQKEAGRKSEYITKKQAEKQATIAQRRAYNQEKIASKRAVKEIPEADIVEAGQSLQKSSKDADRALSEDYKRTVEPIINKYQLRTVSTKPLREELVSIFKNNGILDESGKISAKELNNVISPERKRMLTTLLQVSRSIRKNPTVKQIQKLTQDLQSLANFGAVTRTAEEKVFGSLSHKAKESLLNGVEKVAKGKDFEKIKQARQSFAENQPVFEQLRPLSDKFAEQVVSGAKSKLHGTFIEEAISKQPSLRKPIADVVLNDIANKTTTPQSLTKAIDGYGRSTLEKLLGKDQFKRLVEGEKRLSASTVPLEKSSIIPPFERSIPPQQIPYPKFERGIQPEKIRPQMGKTYKTIKKISSSTSNFPFSRTGAAIGYKSIKKKQEEQRQ